MERAKDINPVNESNPTSASGYEGILGQQVVSETIIPHVTADKPPSAIQEMVRLTGSKNSKDLGFPNAAGSTKHNKHLESQGKYDEGYPRDALASGGFLLRAGRNPEMTVSTILTSLKYTGTVDNLSNTEWIDGQEVGKAAHQIRDPEHPRSKRQFELRNRGYPFYGAIDTTQKTILGISQISLMEPPQSLEFLGEQYVDIHGETHSVFEGMDASVDWVLSRTAFNPEGLIESIQVNPRHHANESWADSPDSFHHADGSLARHHPEKKLGVASVEVTAETYDAMKGAIKVYEAVLDQADDEQRKVLEKRIEDLEAAALQLKQSIEHFWVESEDPNLHGGFFARGTDRDENGNLHPLAIRSSDMGHLLMSDILDDDDPRIVSIIENLFSAEMLAPNGIRTLSSDSVRYHPDAYHNGTVWPWDTIYIAEGLEKRGYYGLAEELENRIMNLYYESKSLPEYGSGGDDELVNFTRQVTVYDPALHEEKIEQFSVYNVIQPPQEIQTWTTAAVMAIKFKRTQRKREGNIRRFADHPAVRERDAAILSRVKAA